MLRLFNTREQLCVVPGRLPTLPTSNVFQNAVGKFRTCGTASAQTPPVTPKGKPHARKDDERVRVLDMAHQRPGGQQENKEIQRFGSVASVTHDSSPTDLDALCVCARRSFIFS